MSKGYLVLRRSLPPTARLKQPDQGRRGSQDRRFGLMGRGRCGAMKDKEQARTSNYRRGAHGTAPIPIDRNTTPTHYRAYHAVPMDLAFWCPPVGPCQSCRDTKQIRSGLLTAACFSAANSDFGFTTEYTNSRARSVYGRYFSAFRAYRKPMSSPELFGRVTCCNRTTKALSGSS